MQTNKKIEEEANKKKERKLGVRPLKIIKAEQKSKETTSKQQGESKADTGGSIEQPELKDEKGGFSMDKDIEERLAKMEDSISKAVNHFNKLAQKQKEEEERKRQAQAQAEIDKRIEERTKAIQEESERKIEELKKTIEDLKKKETPQKVKEPEPKIEEKKEVIPEPETWAGRENDPEYQNRIVYNVRNYATPDTRKKISQELSAEERLCLEEGTCPINIVKQLEEKGFVMKTTQGEKEPEEKKEKPVKSILSP